ncbi:MAG TPA: hypothetical protein VM074_01335 [Solimonas sp.]|nr:hypothetical protein [Solimonas sp.]
MPKQPSNLFDAAMRGVRVLKQGDIVCLIADGGGAMITPTADFLAAQKWASRKPETGNRVSDRGRFLDQLPVIVARSGSFVGTRGPDKFIEKLAKAMVSAGYDLGEWTLPPAVKALSHPRPAAVEKKKDPAHPEDGSEAATPEPEPPAS